MSKESSTIQVERFGEIVEITLCDETTRNSLTSVAIETLTRALNDASSDNSVRAVIISHAGKTFCSGHNAKELLNLDRDGASRLFRSSADLMLTIRRLTVPVAVTLDGGAIGAGCQLALSADILVSTSNGYFQTAGGSKGWFCFTPSVPLCEALPWPIASPLLMGGAKLSAEAAMRWGLITELAGPGLHISAARDLCKVCTQGDRAMIARGKAQCLANRIEIECAVYQKAVSNMAETLFSGSAQSRLRSIVDGTNKSKAPSSKDV
jgi:enoyl-CoA hydratase/carnithine racemase